jgi:hypothetical protein
MPNYQQNKFESTFGTNNRILEIIRNETLVGAQSPMEDSPIYKRGLKSGKSLELDTKYETAAIEKQFEGYETILNENEKELFDIKTALYRNFIAKLKGDIEQLKTELDGSNENSKKNKLQKKIESLNKEIEIYQKRSDESDFIEGNNQTFKVKLDSDIEELKSIIETRNGYFNIIKRDLQALIKYLEQYLSKVENNRPNGNNEYLAKIKEIKILIEAYLSDNEKEQSDNSNWFSRNSKVVIELFRPKKNNILQQKIKELSSLIEEKTENIYHGIQETKPFVNTKFELNLKFFIAVLIITGEFFVVFTFITKVAGIAIQNFTWGELPQYVSSILFSFAYPFALGYFFRRFLHSTPNKILANRILFGTSIGFIIIALFSASYIINFGEDSELNVSTFLERNPEISFKYIFTSFYLLSKILFYPILTFLFSVGGTLYLNEYLHAYRQYNSHHRLAEISKDKPNVLDQNKRLIHEIERELSLMYEKLNNLNSEIAEYQSLLDNIKQPMDYSTFISSMKSLAVSIFMAGYNDGRIQALSEMDEDRIIIYNLKQNFFKND